MTTVSGAIRDTQGNALSGTQVTVKYLRPLVGADGGAAVANIRVLETDGSGILTIPDLLPGHYEITVSAPTSSTSASPLFLSRSTITVNGEPTQTLESALDTNVITITPNAIQQAIAARDAAQRAQSVASISEKTANYTLQDSDKGTFVVTTGASPVTITIPTDATGGFTETVVISLQQQGTGMLSIAADSGVTLDGISAGSTDIQQQWGAAQVIRLGANAWTVLGLTYGVAA